MAGLERCALLAVRIKELYADATSVSLAGSYACIRWWKNLP